MAGIWNGGKFRLCEIGKLKTQYVTDFYRISRKRGFGIGGE
jgi:hypothetical protein